PQATILDLRQVHLELMCARRAAQDADGLAVAVDALVEPLEVVEISREQALDERGADLRDVPEPRDRPREEEHGEIRLVLADLDVAQGLDLIARRREAHRPLAVRDTALVDVAPGKGERDLGLHLSIGS